jgi:hypothetical protein
MKTISRIFAFLWLATIGFSGISKAAEGSLVLFDVNFSAPEHEIDHMPTTGQNSKDISSVVFGSPTVRKISSVMTDRPLEFDALKSYEQIRLQIVKSAPIYRIEFDVASHNLRNSQYAFTVLLDTPQVKTVDLHGGLNQIDVFQPNASGRCLTVIRE